MPTTPTMPNTIEARLFTFLLRQPEAREIVNEPDRGVLFHPEQGAPWSYFLRPDGTDYVVNAAGNEDPAHREWIRSWWRDREAAEAQETQEAQEAQEAAAARAAAATTERAVLIESLLDQIRQRPSRAYEPDAVETFAALRRTNPEVWESIKA